MATSASTNFLRDALAAHVLGTVTYTRPSGLLLGLFTTEVGPAGGGDEVSGNGYQRRTITFSAGSNTGERVNNSMSFPDMPLVTVRGLYVFDTDSNPLYFANFAPVSVAENDTYPVNSGTLIITQL